LSPLPLPATDAYLPYNTSKREAERRAWELSGHQSRWRLVTILPSFVVGPPASVDIPAEGVQFAKDLLAGKFWPLFPRSGFAFIGECCLGGMVRA
jgi:nucleoside-diphosphate-sugar epimerase